MTHHKPLDQQVVAVVGAASGIGRETALRFARRRARVMVADNDTAGLRTLVNEIRREGGTVISMAADVARYEEVQAVADRTVEQFGRLDTWAHVAAVALYATFMDTTPTEFERVISVNLMGQIYGAKAALPHLINAGGGALIHVSSIEARRTFPYHSAYGAAKHGIDGFLEALRVELRHEKIPVSVTQILPASINTPLFDKARTKIGVKPKGIPPFYEPSTVAEAILHAARQPRRDIVVGGAGKMLLTTQRMSPPLLDALLARVGFALQETDEPRTAYDTNDLFGPAGAYNWSRGDFGNQAFSHSLATWLDLHPAAKAAATVGAAVGLGALLGQRSKGQAGARR